MSDPDRAIQCHGRRWDDRLESARAIVPAGEAEAAAGGSAEEAAWRAVVDFFSGLDLCNLAFVAPETHTVRRTRSGRHWKRID